MSRRPPIQLDPTALQRVLGHSRLPLALTREGRVVLIAEAAAALLNDQLPSMESRVFVAGALSSWLQQGGDLTRDFLRVTKPQSKRTASRIFQEIQRENFDHRDEGEPSSDAGELERDDSNSQQET